MMSEDRDEVIKRFKEAYNAACLALRSNNLHPAQIAAAEEVIFEGVMGLALDEVEQETRLKAMFASFNLAEN